LQMTTKRSAATISALAIKSIADLPGPASIPIFGSISNYKFGRSSIENYHNDLVSMQKRFGDIFKVKLPFGAGYRVHIFKPEDARTLFLSDGKKPYIVPLQSTTQKYRQLRGMNPGLGNLNGDDWYRLRSAIQQAMMRPDSVYEYLPSVNEVAHQLVDHIAARRNENGEADFAKIAGRWSLESAGLIVFEKRLGALSNKIDWADKMVDLNKQIFRLSAKMKFGIPVYEYVMTPNWWKMVKMEDKFYWEVDQLSTDAIAKLTNEKEDSQIRFASKLINKPNLSVNDLKTILLSLFSDGLSTTAPTLIYTLFVLATNPDAQEKLREELRSVNPTRSDWTIELLNRTPYLRACLKESFRMHTITTEISRVPQQDVVLSGYLIPAKTPVDIHTSLTLRNSSSFVDPEQFKPERWLREEKSREDNRPFLSTPFGHGPRMCAGRRFAEQDLHVVIATLLSAFEISHHHSPLTQKYETLLMPEGNCNFRFDRI
ncbi:cyp-44A1, partial [Pristionchus pacificus]